MLNYFRNWGSHKKAAVGQDVSGFINNREQELEVKMEYRALDQDHNDIRLLEIMQPDNLHRHAVDRDRASSGLASWQLKHYPLRNWRQSNDDSLSGRFVALSYTWGDKNDLDEIIVDGLTLVVQSNLKKALLALQATSFVQAGCRVWTDAVCINQKNIVELNHSIKRMKSIYSQAESVVIWLGDAAHRSNEAIDLINAVAAGWAGGPESLRKCLRETFAVRGPKLWDALSDLIMRDYWSRLWIIQEMVLGGKDSIIICGGKVTTWEDLYRVYDSFHLFKATHKEPEVASIVQQELKSADAAVYQGYRDVRLWQWEKCEDYQILMDAAEQDLTTNKRHLLTRCRLSKCLKPVDKVYGILGLLEPAISEEIRPNYELSLRDVYIMFAKAWIRVEAEKGDLGFLIQCGETGEKGMNPELSNENLPSWVPDLRKEIKLQINNFELEYNAHGGLKPSYNFVRNGSALSLKGILLDKIDGLSGTRHWDDDWGGFQDIESTKNSTNAYFNENRLKEALWRAMVGDRDRHGQAADPSYAYILDIAIFDESCAPPNPCPSTGDTDESFKWNIHLWLKRNASFRLGGRSLQSFFQDLRAMEHEPEQYFQSLGRMASWMWSRRLAVTESGYIGVMPRVARSGDVIALIPGCSCPILLRAQGDTFCIVAECYVQGIMQGEIRQQIKEGNWHYEEILIS